MQNPAALDAAARSMENHLVVGGDAQPPVRRPTNHFFHFDGNVFKNDWKLSGESESVIEFCLKRGQNSSFKKIKILEKRYYFNFLKA